MGSTTGSATTRESNQSDDDGIEVLGGASDIAVSPARLVWNEPLVPVWAVRAGVVIASSLLGSLGGSFVWIHTGGFDDRGLWPDVGTTMIISIVVALAVTLIPWFQKRALLRWAVSLGLLAVVAFLTADGFTTLIVGVGLMVGLIVVFTGFGWLRRQGKVLFGRASSLAGVASVALLTVSLQVLATGSAFAFVEETDLVVDASACDSDVALFVDSASVGLDHGVGSNPDAHPTPLDLASDVTWNVEVRSAERLEGRRVVTVELIRTSPIDVVRGQKYLIWHTEIRGEDPKPLQIALHREHALSRFVARVGGTDIAVEPFAGVGTFHVTILEVDEFGEPGDRCVSEVNVRVAGSPWGTGPGRAALAALVIGAAGCASTAATKPRVVLPSGSCVDLSVSGSDGPAPQDASGTYQLSTNEQYELCLEVSFLQLEEDREKIEQLGPRDLVSLSGIAGLVVLTPSLSISPAGTALSVTPFRLTRGGIQDDLVATIGQESLRLPVRTASLEQRSSRAEVDR